MLGSRYRRRLAASDGFTLIEVLVVVLIIGILASIALASFLNQRSKAQDAGAKNAATTAATAMLVWHSEHGDFAGATPAALIRLEPALAQARGLDVEAGTNTFTVTVESASAPGAQFAVERAADGAVVRTCALPGTGSCAADADEHGNRW